MSDAVEPVEVVWDRGEPAAGPPRWRRKRGVIAGAAPLVVLALIAVPLAIDARGAPEHPAEIRLGRQSAGKAVLAALDATTNAGNYDMEYSVRTTPAKVTTATSADTGDHCVTIRSDGQAVSMSCAGHSSPVQAHPVDVSGRGTVSLDPYAELTVSNVTGFGEITLRTDGTRVWEYGGADYGTAPAAGEYSGDGNSLSNFAGIVLATLGQGPGALSMIGLANPTGYLQLEKDAITHAVPAGAGTVDGTAVTYYCVTVDLGKILDSPGLSAEQSKSISAALRVLDSVGYRSTQEKVGIDEAGFIREATVVSDFGDGSAMTRVTKLSNFGCAGTVVMPGQPAPSTTAPAHCESPDTRSTTTSEPATTTAGAATTPELPTTTTEPSTTNGSTTTSTTTSSSTSTKTSTTSGATTTTTG